MNPSLNLYPAKIQAQCVCAITQLDEQISALNVLKGSITEFVNDSSIHSVSFDQLKSQCRNYPDVIDAMIYCNEADKADFVTLQGSVGNENLIGADIDKWERYYEQKREEAREKRKMAPLQMAAYFDTLIQMYTELYNLWYAKELAYYEIDGKTSTLFAKSYGRQANSNLLSALKDSFKLEEGYNSSVVAAQAIKVKNAMTGSMQMEPEVMAAWDALIKSGKTYSEAEKIITDIRLNNPEILDKINHVISSAGYQTGLSEITNSIEKYYKANDGKILDDDIKREKAIEIIKRNEAFVNVPYNGGKTIGYGTDIYLYGDLMGKWSETNPISEAEADELLRNEYQRLEEKLDDFLDSNNLQLSDGAYVAAMDLLYNRNMNDMTKEVIRSMADGDVERTKTLLSNFDYEYADRYLDVNPQAYVDRNKGLKIRREEEYNMFINGIL